MVGSKAWSGVIKLVVLAMRDACSVFDFVVSECRSGHVCMVYSQLKNNIPTLLVLVHPSIPNKA